jgi:uncharacterized membrane protein YeiH
VLLGVVTASFGGIIRDILAGDVPLALRKEIYVTAAFLGSATFSVCVVMGLPYSVAGPAGFVAGFGLRALAILRDWSLPPFTARTG